jgi:uncharacterized protein
MTSIKLGPGLDLPLEIVTQAVAILAKRRAGKSYLARRLVEQLFDAGQQIVIVDPKGDWWGIRSGRDGKSPGKPIVIIGGERGDVALEVSAGEIVAKLIVEERVSALLDLSLLRKHEIATFMTAFLENLYRLKAREIYRTPLMLMIDEADAVAPQKPQQGEERMLGAAEDIVRRGGQRGIGCTLITQRSAVLNKNVLTQVQVLIALRTIAPQDLAALNAWIDVHGTDQQRKILMASLPSLPTGDAWIWSPGWPSESGIFTRVHAGAIATFDSGATPKPGEKRIEPKNLADIDLDSVRKQMAATIERAKADDPKMLRARIVMLERELANARKAPAAVSIEKPVFRKGEIERFERLAKRGIEPLLDLGQRVESLAERLRTLERPLPKPATMPSSPAREFTEASIIPSDGITRPMGFRTPTSAPISNDDDRRLSSASRAFLTVLARRAGKPTSRNQLAVLAGYSSKSSHVDNTISSLRTQGYVSGGRDNLSLKTEGLRALGPLEPLPSGDALVAYWVRELGAAGGAMLQKLVDIYPRAISRDELAEATGYSGSSSHVDNTISALRTRDLIVGGRGDLRASESLFE